MGFIVGLLTLFLVLDCLVLILLVLIQLPKKESGAGLAFGAGASDALFGAGSGTVLTKVTKYAAATFFILAFGLAIIQRYRATSSTSEFERRLANPATRTAPAAPGASTAPAAPGGPATPTPGVVPPIKPSTNVEAPAVTATNLLSAPAASATNGPAK